MEENDLPFWKKEELENEEIFNALSEDAKYGDITAKDVGIITDYTWRYINSSRFTDNYI